MSKRVTIVIDDNLDKKLRAIQAKTIIQNSKDGLSAQSYSFSRVLNDILRKTL